MKTKNELTIILSEKFGNQILSRKDIVEYLESEGLLEGIASAGAMTRFLGTQTEKVGHGKYQISTGNKSKTIKTKIPKVAITPQVAVTNNQPQESVNLMVNTETQNLIPSHFEGFCAMGSLFDY